MKMTKKIVVMLFSILLVSSSFTPALAASYTDSVDSLGTKGYKTQPTVCKELTEKDKEEMKKSLMGQKDEDLGFGGAEKEKPGKLMSLITEFFSDVLADVAGLLRVECSPFAKAITGILKPVNILNVPFIIHMLAITQIIALAFTVVATAVYALNYTIRGAYGRIEQPMEFAFKLFLVIFGIAFTPYLVQAVLNINNMLVYHFMEIPMKFSTINDLGSGMAATYGVFLLQALSTLASVAISSVASGGVTLAILILAIVGVLIGIMIKLVKFILWWYIRMLLILFYTVLMPFFLVLYLFGFEGIAKRGIAELMAHIFSQLIFAMAFYFTIGIIASLGQLKNAMDFGLLGSMFIIYALFHFLQMVPTMAIKMLGGGDNPMEKAVSNLSGTMGALAATGMELAQVAKNKNDAKNRVRDDINNQGNVMNKTNASHMNDAISGVLAQSRTNEAKLGGHETGLGTTEERGSFMSTEATSDASSVLNGADEAVPAMASIDTPTEAVDVDKRDQAFMEDIASTLRPSSDLDRDNAKAILADKLMSQIPERYEGNNFKAIMDAEAVISSYEAKSDIGWNAQAQIDEKRKKGELTTGIMRNMIEDDHLARKGENFSRKEANAAFDRYMSETGLENYVGTTTSNERNKPEPTTAFEFGDVKVKGGKASTLSDPRDMNRYDHEAVTKKEDMEQIERSLKDLREAKGEKVVNNNPIK